MKKSLFLFALLALIPLGAHADSIEGGDLITCVETDAVYYYGDDGHRYVFQNEASYFSWQDDFEEVVTISCDDLSNIGLEGIVPYQAGTQLVKIPSVPVVYAVEPDGILREIPDEETAIELYGEDWASLVHDLDESFFPQYELGDELEDDELPEGMILKDEDGTLYRIDEDGTAVEATDLVDENMADKFDEIATVIDELLDTIEELLEYIVDGEDDFEETIAELMEKYDYIDIPDSMELDEFPDFEELTDEEIEELMEDMHDDDTDGDGLYDSEEEEVWGTDPENYDTDGDGFGDGEEVMNGFDPLGDGELDPNDPRLDAGGDDHDEDDMDDEDKDEDDMEEHEEDEFEFDEPEEDLDDDGLFTSEEAFWGTDEELADTDGDGVEDGQEVLDGTDPTDEDDFLAEDHENEMDEDEEKDDDGEMDQIDDETDNEFDNNPSGYNYDHDDQEEDKDGDGLTVLDEWIYQTDPENADTDGDGVDDGQEILDETDPTDPDDVLVDNATGDVTLL